MQVQVNIEFDQLVEIAKKLPKRQWVALKTEVEAKPVKGENREAVKKLLLNGPVFSKEQLNSISEARKKINQWRTK